MATKRKTTRDAAVDCTDWFGCRCEKCQKARRTELKASYGDARSIYLRIQEQKRRTRLRNSPRQSQTCPHCGEVPERDMESACTDAFRQMVMSLANLVLFQSYHGGVIPNAAAQARRTKTKRLATETASRRCLKRPR